ncbi:UPF0302 protein YpiB [Sporosarcina sp. NCCP-2716]|uniref:ReoY family proteolytic degradation factor n=1 Tax=Sporosarcina sp. NCCP-2716 TaxID=2943679 RepID=UPI0020418326|nr:ReoY family proteolytic degradation factor [Sporosarcina sp. NCCP-2716]GKV67957.1 UPF0302 protein YpiB [Sporosarcina sp. NCCP-2716]
MEAIVPVAAKRDFIRWFLKRYRLKRRECVWILNYLLSHEKILQNVHFTEDAHFCPRAMVISTIDSNGVPFRFYKGSLMTTDAEKSFHDLRLHPEEKMFIQLNFQKSNSSPHYASVLEENPYFPVDQQVSERDRRIAQKLLEESTVSVTKETLMKQVDAALDANDEKRFLALSGILNELNEQKEH